MKTVFFGLCLTLFAVKNLAAQQVFVPFGKITYEKRVNMQRKTEEDHVPEEAREKIKKYRTSEWDLYFGQDKSLYKSGKKEVESESPLLFLSLPEPANELYTNYSNHSRVIKKNILGEDYLFKDTIPAVEWKIMHDLRPIAGYACRKAIGRINDTVYVVAFYAEEILLRGGPEGFSGLPGMILGLAIPRYHTTWFATRVDGYVNSTDQIVAPTKGRKIETDRELQKILEIYSKNEGFPKQDSRVIRNRLFGLLL